MSKQAVYRGEDALERLLDVANTENGIKTCRVGTTTLVLPVERKFASLETVRAYVDKVLELVASEPRDWANNSGPIKVRHRKGDTKATYCCGVIAIPSKAGWAMREVTVLHEIAHHLNDSYQDGDHGPKWRYGFIKLLELCIAPEAALALQVLWFAEGVK
jgi:putative metallohydrolase (TIGR04338 family)